MIRESLLGKLEKIVGDGVLGMKKGLRTHSYGTTNWIHEPDAVVFSADAKEVSAIEVNGGCPQGEGTEQRVAAGRCRKGDPL